MSRTFEHSLTTMLIAFVAVFLVFVYFQVPDDKFGPFLALSAFGCLAFSAACAVVAFHAGAFGLLMTSLLLFTFFHYTSMV